MSTTNKNIQKFTRVINVLFVAIVFIALLIPFICMSFAKTDNLSGSTELAEEPRLIVDGKFNTNFMSEAGKYFEDHFAFRTQLVTVNSLLRYSLFNESATNQVVAGNEGYMFYSGEMDDYFSKSILSEVELEIIAHNLSLIQNQLVEQGQQFVFLVAPNKSSIMQNNMPWNCLSSPSLKNAENLKPYLQKYNINYVDCFDLFCTNPQYLKTDSHWNNIGALAVANNILNNLIGSNEESINSQNIIKRKDFDGDLFAMLFPSLVGNETQYYLPGINDGAKGNMSGEDWQYTKGSSVEDSEIATKTTINYISDSSISTYVKKYGINKSIYMFRDSFGNALIPYFSSIFNNAQYTKMVPYDLTIPLAEVSDVVVIERAERHLPYLAQNAPIMAAPELNIDFSKVNLLEEKIQNLQTSRDGNMLVISGDLVDLTMDEESNVSWSDIDSFILGTHTQDGSLSFYKPFFETYSDDNGVKHVKFVARLWNDQVVIDNNYIKVFKIQ